MGMEKPQEDRRRKQQMESRNFTPLTRAAFAAGSIIAGAQLIPKDPDKPEVKTEHSERTIPRLETPPEQKEGLSEEDFDMLAQNVYHEARGESVRGKLAVAQVTLARIGSHGDSVTDVVFKKKQFSWTDDPKILMAPIKKDELAGIRAVLRTIIGRRSVQEAVFSLSNITGIPANALYYKDKSWNENDPNEKRMSKKNKEFFQKLVLAGEIDTHRFYIDKEEQKRLQRVREARNKPRS